MIDHVAATPLLLLLSFALNAKAPDAFIAMSAPRMAFGLMFPLQMPHSLFSTIWVSLRAASSFLFSSLLSAYPFVYPCLCLPVCSEPAGTLS